MGDIVSGSAAAKSLGIYLGQLYGWVKAGKVTNHKADGKYVVDGGKGLEVDIEEARAVWMSSKKKGSGGGPRAPRQSKAKVRNEDGTVSTPKTRRLKQGTMVSWENGHRPGTDARLSKPRYTVAQVLGSTGRLTYLDDGDHRRHYDGTMIDNTAFGTERLSTMLAKGVARIEHPVPVLGMVLLTFVMDDRLDLAQSLETWLEENDLPVVIPEIMDIEEEEEDEPVRGQPVIPEGEVDDE